MGAICTKQAQLLVRGHYAVVFRMLVCDENEEYGTAGFSPGLSGSVHTLVRLCGSKQQLCLLQVSLLSHLPKPLTPFTTFLCVYSQRRRLHIGYLLAAFTSAAFIFAALFISWTSVTATTTNILTPNSDQVFLHCRS